MLNARYRLLSRDVAVVGSSRGTCNGIAAAVRVEASEDDGYDGDDEADGDDKRIWRSNASSRLSGLCLMMLTLPDLGH